MGWILPIAVFIGVATGAIVLRRFVDRRNRELFGDEEPPYQDPAALPTPPGPAGGVS